MAEKEKKKKRERVVSPVARASFPNLAEPDSGREFSDDKYKLTLLFPKAADLKTLKAAVAKAAREEWGAEVDLKTLLLPFRDGSEKEDSFYHEYVYITAKSMRKPGVINMAKEPMNPGDVYGGCFVRANLTAFPYTTTVQVEKDDGKGGTKLVSVVLLYPLQAQLILESGQHVTRSMVVQTGLFVSTQPPRAATAER